MKMDWVPGRNGYDIPVRAAWAGEEQAVIICHGFGSSKASPMVEALMQTLPQHGITAVAFDFPAHGDSPVDGAYLRVPYCIDDLETVEAWVRTILPKASIATVYKGNIIKNLIMDCQSYTKYRPNETTGGIFVSWRRKEELPTGA